MNKSCPWPREWLLPSDCSHHSFRRHLLQAGTLGQLLPPLPTCRHKMIVGECDPSNRRGVHRTNLWPLTLYGWWVSIGEGENECVRVRVYATEWMNVHLCGGIWWYGVFTPHSGAPWKYTNYLIGHKTQARGSSWRRGGRVSAVTGKLKQVSFYKSKWSCFQCSSCTPASPSPINQPYKPG